MKSPMGARGRRFLENNTIPPISASKVLLDISPITSLKRRQNSETRDKVGINSAVNPLLFMPHIEPLLINGVSGVSAREPVTHRRNALRRFGPITTQIKTGTQMARGNSQVPALARAR